MPEHDRRAQVFRALGDPKRLAIVDLLAVQDLSPDALAAAVHLPDNLLAHHLKVLQNAGLVSRHQSQHDRRRTYVRLEADSLEGLLPRPGLLAAARVVFVCTHNSARSVLAEALWQAASDVPAASAGTRPARRINPRARVAARRAGLTLATEAPKALEDVLQSDDVVISVCDAVNEELRGLANLRLHWSVPDPAVEDTDEAFNAVVADLRERVDGTATAFLPARPARRVRAPRRH